MDLPPHPDPLPKGGGKRACENLGITDVDLYGGTRHSTMQFYRKHVSTKDVPRLSAHTTSEAGMRYLEYTKRNC